MTLLGYLTIFAWAVTAAAWAWTFYSSIGMHVGFNVIGLMVSLILSVISIASSIAYLIARAWFT